ncbi:hypothetical protein ACWDA8_47445, partial [Streptomyces sp. NPDC001130]
VGAARIPSVLTTASDRVASRGHAVSHFEVYGRMGGYRASRSCELDCPSHPRLRPEVRLVRKDHGNA